MRAPIHLFHVIPSFALGGAQVRICQIVNHLGSHFRHTVVAIDGDFSARKRVRTDIEFREVRCKRTSNPLLMARALRALMDQHRAELVLTYNWGAVDGVLAALAPPRIPTIHTEDGFGLDEAVSQKRRRVLTRRLVLPHTSCVVAPSTALLNIMRNKWSLSETKTRYIPNGIDGDVFRPAHIRPGHGRVIIGTVAQLRPEKRIDRLIRVVAVLSKTQDVEVRIAGDGPEKEALQTLSGALGMSTRIRFLGTVDTMPQFYRGLDIFALTSDTEQMPYSVLEAMAAGLPVVSTDVGDIKAMVSADNHGFVVPEDELAPAFVTLIDDIELRRKLGASNRMRCCEEFDVGKMMQTYEGLYRSVV